MKIYISGPISGTPHLNKQSFAAAESFVRHMGHEAFNPLKNGLRFTAPWADHMRTDIKALMDCDALIYLQGHERSRGASLEVDIARRIGMRCMSLQEFMADALQSIEEGAA